MFSGRRDHHHMYVHIRYKSGHNFLRQTHLYSQRDHRKTSILVHIVHFCTKIGVKKIFKYFERLNKKIQYKRKVFHPTGVSVSEQIDARLQASPLHSNSPLMQVQFWQFLVKMVPGGNSPPFSWWMKQGHSSFAIQRPLCSTNPSSQKHPKKVYISRVKILTY